jgi:hypothetical protein
MVVMLLTVMRTAAAVALVCVTAACVQLSRAAPRTLSLPASLQPLAACQWLMESIRQSPEYHQQQQAQQPQQLQQQQQSQHQQPSGFLSWKYRDPAVLTQAGLEASVRQVGMCWCKQAALQSRGPPHVEDFGGAHTLCFP